MKRLLDEEFKLLEECRRKLVEKYAEKDADGNIKAGEQQGTVKLADPRGLEKEMEEFGKKEVLLDFQKLPLKTLQPLKLNAADYAALECFIDAEDSK